MKQSRQVNQYDKIFRENLEAVIPGFVDQVLGITMVVAEELPDDIQHTKERKPDLLKKITDDKGSTFRNIAHRIAEISHSDFSLKRYYAQLRILAQLRSLELELTKVMIRASDFFKEERDPFYIRGVEKKNRSVTKALLAENKFSVEDIARLVDVSVEFVEQIRKEMNA